MRRRIFIVPAILLSVMILSGTSFAQQRFVAALNTIQEVPPPTNSSGRGACTIVLNLTETQITVNCSFSNLSSNATAAHIHGNAPPGVNAPVLFPLGTPPAATSGTLAPAPITVTPAQVADMRAKRLYVNIHSANFPGGEIRGQIKITTTPYDEDGDGRTDINVFRQSDNTVYSLFSVNNTVYGNRYGSGSGDNYFSNNHSSDFDGDGRADLLIIKVNQTNGDLFWSILQTATNTVRTVQWGNALQTNGETLPIADYDGDGKQDIAVFRRANGFWYIIDSSTNTARVVQNFGAVGDFPSVGDYDKDGKADLTVVRQEGGAWAWYTQLSSTGQQVRVLWGIAPTDGFFFFANVDIDGDGAQDRLTRRAVNGQNQFNILRSSDNAQVYLSWGVNTGSTATSDQIIFGDYDGDGKTDIVARRSVNGQWLWQILQSSTNYNPQQARYQFFGLSSDQ